jgi:hypothetical protein
MHTCMIKQDGGGANSLVQAKEFVDRGLAQVGVNNHHSLAGLGKSDCEVRGNCGLALGR